MSAPPAEQRQIIAFLAKESTASIDDVTRLYEHERAGLAASARKKRLLPIITIRTSAQRCAKAGSRPAQFVSPGRGGACADPTA